MLQSNWITASLGEVVKFASGGTPSRENASYWNGDIPWFSAKDLKKFQLLDSEEHITENGLRNGTRVIEPNTILILVRGMTLLKSFPVGMTTRRSAFNQDLRAVIPNDCLDREFLAYWLTANESKVMALVDQAGHGTGRLAADRLANLDISFPSNLFEQQAIAHVLSAWDRGIRQLSDLIAAKLRFKQGLMQQLLTGRRRFKEFKGQWEHVHIGNIATERSERNEGKDSITVFSCTKYDGLVDSLTYFGKRVFSEDTTNYKVVRKSDFAYATNHIEEGSIGLLSHADAGLVSPMYTVFRTKKELVAPEFLFRLLKTEAYRQIFASFTSASVNRRGSLRWKQFATIPLRLPSLAEQHRIDEILAVFDREINILRRQLDALKTQKKGLMQKLLTGQVRVASGGR